MIGRMIFAAGAAAVLAAMPVSAQDAAPPDDPMAALAAMFTAEPLTAEQAARLPAARLVVDRMMPPGAMGEMMQSMFGGILDPLMKMGLEPSAGEVAKEVGLKEGALDLTEEQAREAAAILDPAWTERRQREFATMKSGMTKAMTAMEPAMRDGMAQAYAVHFTAAELADVAAFFATPSGASYARKSYTLASDPRIMGTAMQAMPGMMAEFAALAEEMKAATADLPPRRAYDDLSAQQRERLAELTGLDASTLSQGMARAQAMRDGEASASATD